MANLYVNNDLHCAIERKVEQYTVHVTCPRGSLFSEPLFSFIEEWNSVSNSLGLIIHIYWNYTNLFVILLTHFLIINLAFASNFKLKFRSLQSLAEIKSYILYGENLAPLILFCTKHVRSCEAHKPDFAQDCTEFPRASCLLVVKKVKVSCREDLQMTVNPDCSIW